MTRRLLSAFWLIFWSTSLLLGLKSVAAADQLRETSENTLVTDSPSVYLPLITNYYPQDFVPEIAKRIWATDRERFEQFTRSLVNLYSPRHHDIFQLIDNPLTCSRGGTLYDKHNLLRSLEDAEAKFTVWGYQITHEPVPNSNGSYNLVAVKPASQAPFYTSFLDVGAHLDTVEITPGASDNSAGSAGVLEMAALLQDYPNQHPWRFILFVEEENGLVGSRVHVQLIHDQPFKIALVMDTIGWSETEPKPMNCLYASQYIPFSGEVAGLFDTIRQRYAIPIGWRRCTYTSWYSDQGRYWEAGLPAVLSVGGLPYKDPTLHKCSDNLGNLDMENAFLTVQENVGVLLTLDREP